MFLELASATTLDSITKWPAMAASVTAIQLPNGQQLDAHAVAPGIFHVRLSSKTAVLPSLIERYAVVRTDWPAIETSMNSIDNNLILKTADAELAIHKKDGTIVLRDGRGRLLCPALTPLLSDRLSLGDPLRGRVTRLIEQFRNQEDPGSALKNTLEDAPSNTVIQPNKGFGLLAQLQPGERFYGLGV